MLGLHGHWNRTQHVLLGLVANRTVPSKHAGVLSSAPTTGVFDCRAFRVKTGDSLSAIAFMFQITVRNQEWCRLAVCCLP